MFHAGTHIARSIGMREPDDVFGAKFGRVAGADAAIDADLLGAARGRRRCDAPAAAILDALAVAHGDGAEAAIAWRRHRALCADEPQTLGRGIVSAARALAVAVFLFELFARAIRAALAAEALKAIERAHEHFAIDRQGRWRWWRIGIGDARAAWRWRRGCARMRLRRRFFDDDVYGGRFVNVLCNARGDHQERAN